MKLIILCRLGLGGRSQNDTKEVIKIMQNTEARQRVEEKFGTGSMDSTYKETETRESGVSPGKK